MKIHYFFRKYYVHQISIEKLFNTIIDGMQNHGVEVKIFSNNFPFSFIGMFKALYYFKKNQGNINHVTGDIHWAVLGLNRNKTVLTIHDLVGLYDLKGIKKIIYYYLWVYFPIKKLKYITVISEKTKKEIIKVLPEAEKKITVIPNPLTIPVAPLVLDKQNEIPQMLVVGTRSNKNLDRILQAIVDVNVFITIIGEISSEQHQFLEDHHIAFLNKINISDDELIQCYDKADILCFPSLYEGFGLPILEAQARNCAVITSNISPMCDVASDGAIFVNPESSSEIRKALIKLTSDKQLRTEYILKGRENVKNYSLEKVVKQYVELYNKIETENDLS